MYEANKDYFTTDYEEEFQAEKYLIEESLPPTPVFKAGALPGRNDTCYCGSGKKFKKCCGK